VLVQFSQKTLRKYWSQLFDDKCLDEGSLHYFIISQDIIYDINLASQSEQYEVGTDLSEAIIQFTSGKLGTFPAIGDISPDPDLSFLWPDFVKRFRSSTLKQGLFNFSDYLFYFEKELSITAHFRSTWKPIQHSHNDFGAPIVNIGSLPVLIDLGRKNYIVKYGKDSNLSPLDHNCPSIGGLMSSPRIMRDVFPKYFLTQKFEPLKEEDVEKILMQYSLKGTDVIYAFKCENTATKIFRGHWIRLVCLKKPIVQLVILDLVVTKIKCDVELRLNTGLSGRLVQDAITFQVNGETNLPIKRNVMRTSIYGYEESCDSLGVLSTKRKNHVIITRIKA